ncbi:hypothetical protein [Undibacterium sp. Tian12W]|uniref:hypothetical protein n=1 Tax=Undibacterium sp. Tian12W TaxID=3413054 RepID=UPI003BF25205
MKTIRTYGKLLLLSCICAAIGNAFSEVIIAILLRKFFPEEVRSVLSPLDIIQLFGKEIIGTPVFLIVVTVTGFTLLAISLSKHLQAMPLATIVWGSLIGIYLSLVRFMAMTDIIEKIFSYVLPIDWVADSLNFIFFIFVIPLLLLAIIVMFFKGSGHKIQSEVIV